MAALRPTARMKSLRADLPPLLQTLEGRGIREARPEVWWEPGPYDETLRALGILHLFQSGTDYAGSVYFTIEQGLERTGGAVPTDGRPLVEWLATWLARPDKADNLAKLAASGAEERHLFLIVPVFAEAPFAVADLLMRDGGRSPMPIPICRQRSLISGSSALGIAGPACAGRLMLAGRASPREYPTGVGSRPLRGEERAMNTGRDGSLSTAHANTQVGHI